MTRSRAAAVALAVGLSLVALAAPAMAAIRGRIVSVQASNGTLQVVFSAAGLNAGDTIDPASVTLSIGGHPTPVKVQQAAQAQTTVVRRVILDIDTSGSMTTNDRIGAARQAALAFLSSVPADVQVGLITIADTATLRVPPTKDRGVVHNAILGLGAAGNTALYDSIGLAVGVLGKDGDRSILVLSDGKDEGSHSTLDTQTAALRAAKVPVNAVVLGDTSAQQSLIALSNAAGGRVVAAQVAADLTKTFVEQARASDKDIAVTASIPAGYTGGSAPVVVTATVAGQQVSDTVLAVNLVSASVPQKSPQTYGPQPVAPLHGLFRHKLILYVGLLALLVGFGTLLAFGLNGIGARPQTMTGRLRPYVNSGGARKKSREARSVKEAAVGIADDFVKQRGLEEAVALKLEAAGIPLRAAEWLILHVAFAVLFPLLIVLISDMNPALSILAVLLGILGPLGYLTVKATLRMRAFLAQLPDTLQLLSGSLSAGYSLPQAVDAVVRQGNAPMADELRKALVEARLGAPMEDALDDIADRMGSKDFHWVVMAIRVQRQVGGNLAEVLATTAATLRERERLRRQVQVLSAEGRLSAGILFGLPVVFSLYLLATRPAYLKPLVTDPIGWIMLVGMGIALTVGGLWLRKVVKVEV